MHLIHRGIVNKNYKENLLKSFQQSFKKGYGIETDIHATKDEKFICFHDFTLKRIFKNKSSIKNLNYSAIEKISKGKIPLLNDLLKASKNKYFLFIEITCFNNGFRNTFICTQLFTGNNGTCLRSFVTQNPS